jgi:hypothetical protein
MSAVAVAAITFACTFAAGLLGLMLRLREEHLSDRSRDAVRLVQALVASIAALVLGLLIAGASDHYRTQAGALSALASKLVVLDGLLVEYGPETRTARVDLRAMTERMVAVTWGPRGAQVASSPTGARVFEDIARLTPDTPRQQFLHSHALQMVAGLAEARALLAAREDASSIQPPLLIVLIGWFVLLFLATGLFARPNATVLVALLAGSAAVAGALFLVIEMDHPFEGIMIISDQSLRNALPPINTP